MIFMGKRILLVSDTYLPVISGVTTVVSQLAKTLRERGHIVKVLVLDDPKLPNDPNILAVPSFPGFFRSDVRFAYGFRGLSKKIKEFAPDVIHVHSPGNLGIWTRYWAQIHKVKLVTTVHGIPAFSASYIPFGLFLKPVIRYVGWKFWRWFLATSEVVLAPSHYIIEELQNIGMASKAIRAPFWIEPFSRKLPKKKSKTTTFLFFGRLDPDKNLPFLLESWSRVTSKDARLIIAGRVLDNQLQLLNELTKQLGCEKTVKILGTVTERKKASLFRNTDFFVMPSTVEVQSIVTYQAAISGIPVLVANASALPEIVKNSTLPNLLFDPEDPDDLATKIVECITHAKTYKQKYHLKKTFAKAFTKQSVLTTLEQKVY